MRYKHAIIMALLLCGAVLSLRADDLEQKTTPPRVVKQTRPNYPSDMARSGMRGEVLLEIFINDKGHVEKATVVKSDNPAFDKPAIDAVLTWTFAPATRDGLPVSTTARQPIVFEISLMPDGGRSAFEVIRGNPSKLPPEFRYDVAPKPQGVALAVYPYELLRKKQTGKATVVLFIDTEGAVSSVSATKANAPEFGLAAMAAAEQFSFTPASKAGQPIWAALHLEMTFSRSATESYVQAPDFRLLKREVTHPETIVKGDQLDRPLRIVSQKAPIFPSAQKKKSRSGRATVEFLIDEKGNVALPRIISSDAPEFGYAAVQAVSTWQFDPPTANGKAVITRARVPFDFKFSPHSTAHSK